MDDWEQYFDDSYYVDDEYIWPTYDYTPDYSYDYDWEAAYNDSNYTDAGDYLTNWAEDNFDWDTFYADYGNVGMEPNTEGFDWYGIDSSEYNVTEIPNESAPGDEAYGWKYYSDGTVIDPSGKYYYPNEAGDLSVVYDPSSQTGSLMSSLLKAAPSKFTKTDASGNKSIDWGSVATAAAGLVGAYAGYNTSQEGSGYQTVGYKGTIPEYTAVRTPIEYEYDPNRRPGSMGRSYFTDVAYASPSNAAQAAADQEALAATIQQQSADRFARAAALSPEKFLTPAGIAALPTGFDAQTFAAPPQEAGFNAETYTAPMQEPGFDAETYTEAKETETAPAAVTPTSPQEEAGFMAQLFNEGGSTGRYLRGQTDGMADEIPTSIDGKDPAALSHGEFVIPADVVSHLGNGNSDAGARKLHEMMDEVRKARTGTTEQGKRINPDKFMPGGLAKAYAEGGGVKKYAEGAAVTSSSKGLSEWVAPYVTDMLGKGMAATNMPYTAYQGPLTAGSSPLQEQAFGMAAGLNTPSSVGQAAQTAGDIAQQYQGLSYTPTTQNFDAQAAQQYMNPYLQAALEPQLREARRQSQMSSLADAAKLTQAGAFGGSRQAIMQSEANRNLGQQLSDITGTGYANAYQQAMAQFNADQARQAQEAQFGAQYGLQGLAGALGAAQAQGALGAQQNQLDLANLSAIAGLGTTQRGIEAEGIAADKAQFEEQRDWPFKMLQFQNSLLSNVPLETSGTYIQPTNPVSAAAGGAAALIDSLKKLGLLT